MEIHKSKIEDIHQILEVIRDAQKSMCDNGIPQWQDGYPNEMIISRDIQAGNSYVLVDGKRIVGAAYIIAGHEPSYDYIEGGQWLMIIFMLLYIALRYVKTTRARVLLVI